MAENQPQGIKTIRKITVKAVHGKIDIKELVNSESGRQLLMRVAGVARRAKLVTTDYGDSIGFIGEFAAVNTKGERYRASKMYLPKVMEEELEGIITAGSEAEFAFDIWVVYDDTLAVKYFYEAVPVVQAQQSDAAQRMFALLEPGAGGDTRPQLTDESKDEKVDTETGEVKGNKSSRRR